MEKTQLSHHMEPYVPAQGSARWLIYLDWDLAETSAWVKSVQREQWRAICSGRVVCRPWLSVAAASSRHLFCKSCVRHQNKCTLKVEHSIWIAVGELWVYCEPLGCRVWSVWPPARRQWATFFAWEFFRLWKNLGFDLGCCGGVYPQTSLLSQVLFLTLLLVKGVVSFHLCNLGDATQSEVPEERGWSLALL